VHAQRLDGIRGFLADVTQDELDRVRDTNPAAAWPPPGNRTAVQCLHVVFFDAWAPSPVCVARLGGDHRSIVSLPLGR
jgi:hypothetical protein